MKTKDSNGKIKIWNVLLNILLISEMNENENLSVVSICQKFVWEMKKSFFFIIPLIEWEEFDWRDDEKSIFTWFEWENEMNKKDFSFVSKMKICFDLILLNYVYWRRKRIEIDRDF